MSEGGSRFRYWQSGFYKYTICMNITPPPLPPDPPSSPRPHTPQAARAAEVARVQQAAQAAEVARVQQAAQVAAQLQVLLQAEVAREQRVVSFLPKVREWFAQKSTALYHSWQRFVGGKRASDDAWKMYKSLRDDIMIRVRDDATRQHLIQDLRVEMRRDYPQWAGLWN
ncbi:hypothetical protein T492DRAFT_419277 [Pavlovales sp. CCMP2436]|nr:hypothetical protein T492DRAFT_419277 [Pavlovales sp. CCMP2436]